MAVLPLVVGRHDRAKQSRDTDGYDTILKLQTR